MNCPKCNAQLIENAKFCGSCGFTIQQVQAQMPPQYQQPQVQQPPQYQQQTQPNQSATNQSSSQGAFKIDDDGRGQGRGYSWEILHQGSFSLAKVVLQAEQAIATEAGAMVSMSANIELQSEMKGGVFGALKRAVGGESAFVSTFTARGGAGEVMLAPATPGAVVGIELRNQSFLLQSGSYLAGDTSLTVDTKFGGAKSFFGGEGLFLVNVSGTGLLLVSSFGAIHTKTLQAGERYVIDTGHLVAWEAQMPYQVRKASSSGFISSWKSGEGLVSEFQGPGEILMQTRNLAAFATQLAKYIPSSGG
ncbi:MAG: TIGR00266 family protein [Pyrinomonadaceae bacterium]|nr:TIGR00266 family protein [Pyrinomonadaceae bacterium]